MGKLKKRFMPRLQKMLSKFGDDSMNASEGYNKWPTLPKVVQNAVVVPALMFGLCAGTGGADTIQYLKARGGMGYERAHIRQISPVIDFSCVSTPADQLAQIREVLHPSVTELANSLGVSRQTVYSWQAGKPIAQENAIRLADLAAAAALFASAEIAVHPQLLRRSIHKGKNLLEIARDGGSAKEAAQSLIEIIRRENRQMEALKAQLADRSRLSREDFEDIGIPALNERG
jgi:DNA-binding XRE family transcriptional regulator